MISVFLNIAKLNEYASYIFLYASIIVNFFTIMMMLSFVFYKNKIINNIFFIINNFVFSISLFTSYLSDMKGSFKHIMPKLCNYVFFSTLIVSVISLEKYDASPILSLCNNVILLSIPLLCTLFMRGTRDYVKIFITIFKIFLTSVRLTIVFYVESMLLSAFIKIVPTLTSIYILHLVIYSFIYCLCAMLMATQIFTISLLFSIILEDCLPKRKLLNN